MTPTEMARVLNRNIDDARAAMEDGPAGFILHGVGCLQFICQAKDQAHRLDSPLSPDVVLISTERSAMVLQRFWNSSAPAELEVSIMMRREALSCYVNMQQAILDTLLKGAHDEPTNH